MRPTFPQPVERQAFFFYKRQFSGRAGHFEQKSVRNKMREARVRFPVSPFFVPKKRQRKLTRHQKIVLYAIYL